MGGLSLSSFLLMKPTRYVREEAIKGVIIKLGDELGGKVIYNGLGSIVMKVGTFKC